LEVTLLFGLLTLPPSSGKSSPSLLKDKSQGQTLPSGSFERVCGSRWPLGRGIRLVILVSSSFARHIAKKK